MALKQGKTVYVSNNGNDLNDGLTPEKPIRTINAAMQKGYEAGDSLLFEGGSVFSGNLVFRNVKGPFTVGSYDAGQPVICSGSKSGIVFEDCSDIVISGIRFEGEGWRVLNNSIGVSVIDCANVQILNVEVTKYHKAGIKCSHSTYVDIIGCFAHDNGSVGITTGDASEYIRIAYCKAYDNAGDQMNKTNHSGSGIVIGGTNHCVVEYCEAAGNGWGQRQNNVNGPVGIWCCCGCTDIVFRWNIARYNRTQPGAVDGDGFDIDGEVADGVMEYNYSYGNEAAGYLFCEFWGDCSDVLWSNNVIRHCISFEDVTRVKGYGAICMYGPEYMPLDRLTVEKNLLVAYRDIHSINNKNISKTCTDIVIRDNVLVTDGISPIEASDNPYTAISGNTEFPDNAVREDIIRHAPLLTNPRDLPKLPVFGMLENGTCAQVLQQKGAAALFGEQALKPQPDGSEMLILRMDGMDLEGCEYSGDVMLYYDSIKPGVATRMNSTGAQFVTPIPWWTKDRKYVIRAKARIQSPDVRACLFLRDSEGNEQKGYFNGTTAEYNIVEIEFTGNDKWFDAGKYIGVRHEGGRGCVFVDSVTLIELNDGSTYTPDKSINTINKWRSFGDCTDEDSAISLIGRGSGIVRCEQKAHGRLSFSAECKALNGDGILFIRCGSQFATAPVSGQEWHRVELCIESDSDTAEVGVWNTSQNGNADGIVMLKNVNFE